MGEVEIIASINDHFRGLAKKDSEHGVVARVVAEIIDRMVDQDMSMQEIASILLPIEHPVNGPVDLGARRE